MVILLKHVIISIISIIIYNNINHVSSSPKAVFNVDDDNNNHNNNNNNNNNNDKKNKNKKNF